LGSEQNSQAVLAQELINVEGQIRESKINKPVSFVEGVNLFLKSLNVTFHTSTHSKHKRPRINKFNSVKDREQKAQNKYYD
jgi:ATP-binding cassette subfamily E protein 1